MDDIDTTLNEELDNDTQMDATLNEELDNDTQMDATLNDDTQMDSTNGRGSPERSVVDSQRGRERLDRSQRAEARSATLDAALNRAREDRATRSTRRRTKSSIIWNHCTQRMVNNVKITFCNHCSCYWHLSGSTTVALQHLRKVHSTCY